MSTQTREQRDARSNQDHRGNEAEDDAQHVVRLSVNLAPSVASALKSTAKKQGITVTEAIRRAIAIWKLVSDADSKGQRVMLVDGHGDRATYREIVML